ncbi:hypothetical protein TRVL_00432 [Trypanosoma vivax]|nr:hypothetical protein TRVL_00432 [Trypanosoma vivax]
MSSAVSIVMEVKKKTTTTAESTEKREETSHNWMDGKHWRNDRYTVSPGSLRFVFPPPTFAVAFPILTLSFIGGLLVSTLDFSACDAFFSSFSGFHMARVCGWTEKVQCPRPCSGSMVITKCSGLG